MALEAPAVAPIVAFARDELGVEFHPVQAEIAGEISCGRYQTAVIQAGRRGGKTLIADCWAAFDAVVRGHLRTRLRPGERRVVGIITPRLDQAEDHIRTLSAWFNANPGLSVLIAEERSDELVLTNGTSIKAMPCSARSIRGSPWSTAVLDEAGHFVVTDSSNESGDRVLEAVEPALSQFGNEGRLLVISTPLWKRGAFWELVQQARSGQFGEMLYRHHSTREMNPAIPVDRLERIRRTDPDLYAREYLAEFIDGTGSYLQTEDVLRAVRRGERRCPPRPRVRYVGAIDPAWAGDGFALGIGHREQGVTVVDGVWCWRREGHSQTLDAIAAIAREYGVRALRTDQAAAPVVIEGLRQRGVAGRQVSWTNQLKADAFAALKVGLNTGTLTLPDDPDLTQELLGLEARPTPSGLTRIAAAGSGHDDRAIVVAAVTHDLSRHGIDPEEVRRFVEAHDELRASRFAESAGARATPARRSLDGLGMVGGTSGFGRWPF